MEGTWKFPQVSDDPDVNRAMNFVLVLTLVIDIKKLCQY